MEFNKETLKIIEKVAAANGGWDNIHSVRMNTHVRTGKHYRAFLAENGFSVADEYYDEDEGWVLFVTKEK